MNKKEYLDENNRLIQTKTYVGSSYKPKDIKLGREIKISPKALIDISGPGASNEYMVDSVSLTIGIGKDHVAFLTMTIDAWKALQGGDVINIDLIGKKK